MQVPFRKLQGIIRAEASLKSLFVEDPVCSGDDSLLFTLGSDFCTSIAPLASALFRVLRCGYFKRDSLDFRPRRASFHRTTDPASLPTIPDENGAYENGSR